MLNGLQEFQLLEKACPDQHLEKTDEDLLENLFLHILLKKHI